MLGFITALLTILVVITALLLIGIILIQQSKSGGGLGAMGGGMTETVFGASAGNVLTKATVILAAVFLGLTLVLAIITGHRRPVRSVVEGMPAEIMVEAATEVTDDDAVAEPGVMRVVEPELPEDAAPAPTDTDVAPATP